MKVDYIFKQGSYIEFARPGPVGDIRPDGKLHEMKALGMLLGDIEVDGVPDEKCAVFLRCDDGRVRPVKNIPNDKRMAEEARNAGNVTYRSFWELENGSRVERKDTDQ